MENEKENEIKTEEEHSEETVNTGKTEETEKKEQTPTPDSREFVNDSDNPNTMEEPEEQNTVNAIPLPKKADELDGEINLQNKVTGESYFKPLNYVYDGFANIDDEVESVRKGYLAKIKKSKIFNFLAIGIMLIAFLGVILVFFLNKNKELAWVTYTVLGVAAVLIIGSFILTSYFAKKDNKHIQQYLADYEDTLGGYLVYKMDVKNPVLCPDAKVDETSFIQAHCYRTISSIDSRSVLECERHNYKLIIAEMAAIVPPVSLAKANELPHDYVNMDGTPFIPSNELDETMTGTTELQDKDMTVVDVELADEANATKNTEKKSKDIEKNNVKNAQKTNRYGLFGRFYSYSFSVLSEESFILYFMGDKAYTNLPDYLTGFKAIKVPGLRSNIICFAADPLKAGRFLDEEGVKLLNAIVPNQVVQSLFLSVNSFGTKIGINLSDDIMNVPVRSRQVSGSLEAYKEANDRIFEFVDYMEKKSSSQEA